MANYIDIVAVRTDDKRIHVYRAPGFQGPEEGDTVLCETFQDPVPGKVIGVISERKDSDAVAFIAKIHGQGRQLPRILSVLKQQNYDYSDEEAEAHTGLPETE